MQNENAIDDLDQRIRAATKEILVELGLNDQVKVRGVEPQIDADRFIVGLRKQTGPHEFAYPFFYIEGIEALEDDLKPTVRREILKLFPD
jgi:hypothetical protein